MIFTKKKVTVDYVKSFFLVFFLWDLCEAGPGADYSTGFGLLHTLKVRVKNSANYETPNPDERCDKRYTNKYYTFRLFLTDKEQWDSLRERSQTYTLVRAVGWFEDEESKVLFYDALDFNVPTRLTLMDIPNVRFEYTFTSTKNVFVEECWAQSVSSLPYVIETGRSLVNYPILYFKYNLPFIQSYGTDVIWEPCKPGYWSTCNENSFCNYVFPLQENPFLWKVPEGTLANYPVDRRPGPNVPIGHCFPCESGMSMPHWNWTNNIVCGNLPYPHHPKCFSNIYDRGTFNRVYCPGEDYPPMLCPVNSVASENMDRCVCNTGTYLDTVSQKCVFCEPGHYCKDNIKYTCPTDTYQPLTGQTECITCVTEDGKSNEDCIIGKLPGRCSLENDPNGFSFLTKRQCVECSQCKNSIIQSELKNAGKNVFYDCYDTS